MGTAYYDVITRYVESQRKNERPENKKVVNEVKDE